SRSAPPPSTCASARPARRSRSSRARRGHAGAGARTRAPPARNPRTCPTSWPATRSCATGPTRPARRGREGGGGRARGERERGGLAWSRNALRQETFTGHEERLRTSDLTLRARAGIGGGILSLLALRAEKVDEGRDPTLSAAEEARWRQSGPVWLLGLEGRRD